MWQKILNFLQFNSQFIIIIGIALLFWAAFWFGGFLLTKKISPLIEKKLNPRKHKVGLLLLRGFRHPVSLYCKVLGLCVALLIISSKQAFVTNAVLLRFLAGLPAFAYQLMRIASIIMVTWGLVASSEIAGLVISGARNKLDLEVSKSVTHFLSAVFKVVVIAISAVLLLSEMNYNINGLITGLGLGGLTVALAAKDSAANFFGGLVLVSERPFEIGDWINAAGVEGTVEDISLRSTKVRTSPGALTIVPNANLSGAAITNWSGGMEKRRADFILPLTYSSSHKTIKEFSSAVRTMLETDPEIIQDSVIVRFAELSEYSLNVRIVFYTALPAFAEHLRIRERVNYALIDIAGQHGIQFAIPSQTVYMGQNDTAPPPPETLA